MQQKVLLQRGLDTNVHLSTQLTLFGMGFKSSIFSYYFEFFRISKPNFKLGTYTNL